MAIAELIMWATDEGIPVTFGDAYRDPRLHGELGVSKGYGHKYSCHKIRLAVDLNIIKDGKIAGAEYYNKLHDYWDTLGGAERIKADLNHFSFEHDGYR